MLHAATTTASHFYRSEVALFQLQGGRINSNSLGLSHKGMDMDPVLHVGLPQMSCARRCFPDKLPEWSQEDMLLKTF